MHLYAIIRFDLNMSGENAATVVKVMASADLAKREAARLNEVNADKKCVYKVQTTRFVDSLAI